MEEIIVGKVPGHTENCCSFMCEEAKMQLLAELCLSSACNNLRSAEWIIIN